jgi:hypothetical protein
MVHRASIHAAEGGRSPSAGFRLYARSGRVIGQSLLTPGLRYPSDSEFLRVFPHPGGFVVTSAGRAWQVSPTGVATALRLVRRSVAVKRGDVFAPIGRAAWIFRPGTSHLMRPQAVPGARITHADGQGRLWALGKPEGGRAVVFSAVPGEPWSKHVLGSFSNTALGCACDTWPGPLGRGSVIVVAGNPLQHLSTDYGRTWTTYDLANSTPYTTVLREQRLPAVSAMPDGRIVIGYFDYWVASDPTNTTFTKLADPDQAVWGSGIEDRLDFHDGKVSPDGGKTWVPLTEIPTEPLTQPQAD